MLEAKRHGTTVDPEKIEQGYQLLIKAINEAYSNTKNNEEEEKSSAFFDSPRHKALLKKPQSMLRMFFHPNFENFSQFQLINHPLYTAKGSEVTAEEFDKKIPAIKEFIILMLGEITTKNEKLRSLMTEIQCLHKEEKISEEAGKTRP